LTVVAFGLVSLPLAGSKVGTTMNVLLASCATVTETAAESLGALIPSPD
jgi:hypothetical protein